MPMKLVDKVRFILPLDREYQFVAVAAMQTFVNTYDEKMKKNQTHPDGGEWLLQYDIDDPDGCLPWFLEIGLRLAHKPQDELSGRPDAVIDLSDARIEAFMGAGRLHAGQVCGILAGVESPTLPQIKQVAQRRQQPYRWIDMRGMQTRAQLIDHEYTGVIDIAGDQTYWAAAAGLPVIEILPVGRSRSWLSKFTNIAYRVVEQNDDMEQQIASAKKSLEELCSARAAVSVI